MDLLEMLVSEGEGKAAGALAEVGFSKSLAGTFLQEAGRRIAQAADRTQDPDPVSVLAALDVEALASVTGASSDLVQKGLQALLPIALEKLGHGRAADRLSPAKTLF